MYRVRTNARRGLTLIELLVGIALVALLITTVLTLYFSTRKTLDGQQARRETQDQTLDTMQILVRDLMCGVADETREACVFSLTPVTDIAHKSSDLSFCASLPTPEPGALEWYDLVHVQYRLEGVGPVRDLVRISQKQWGPETIITNRLMQKVEQFQVTFFDGETWHAAWVPEAHEEDRPISARIQIRMQGREEPLVTEAAIPAGHLIRPTGADEAAEESSEETVPTEAVP